MKEISAIFKETNSLTLVKVVQYLLIVSKGKCIEVDLIYYNSARTTKQLIFTVPVKDFVVCSPSLITIDL